MGNKNEIVTNQFILNLIQDLQRMLLQSINNMRGRCQIKFGMTSLCNNGGFTLIELLVVVLIIGILAAIAVPQYQKAVEKSRYAAMLTLLQTLTKAQQQYYLVHGTYATTFVQLDEVGPALPAQQLSSGYACPSWAASIHRPLGPTECASIVSDIGNGALRVTIPYQGKHNATKAKKAAQTGYYYVFNKFSTLPQAGLYCVRHGSEPAGPCRGTRVMNNSYGQWFAM